MKGENDNLNAIVSSMRKDNADLKKEVIHSTKMKDQINNITSQIDYIRSEKDAIHASNLNLRGELSEVKKLLREKIKKVEVLQKEVDLATELKAKREDDDKKEGTRVSSGQNQGQAGSCKSSCSVRGGEE